MRRFTVPALAEELDALLQGRYPTILVEGEVAQIETPASGHCYLVLRDKGGAKNLDCSLSCVVWRDDWNRLRHRPAVGERVLCRGRVSVFPPRASIQLNVFEIAPVGAGDMAREIEARKARLMADGLLDPRRKRALPKFPRFVGLATSPTGAALQDFLKVSRGRWPAARILLAGCAVQGVETPSSVIRAIELLIEDGRSEVIVVTRGGGSKEDLLPFSDEALARFLATSPVPIVSAVGHQIDTTIADLVADAVAPTPSAAAMLVLPDGREIARRLGSASQALELAVKRQLGRLHERVEARRVQLRHPGDRLRDLRRRLEDLDGRLARASDTGHEDRRRRLDAVERHLEALSPLAVLDRGYAIVSQEGGIVTDPATLADGDRLEVRVKGGRFLVRVERPPGQGVQLRLL